MHRLLQYPDRVACLATKPKIFMNIKQYPFYLKATVVLFGIILFVYCLYYLQDILVPLAFAGIIADDGSIGGAAAKIHDGALFETDDRKRVTHGASAAGMNARESVRR